MERLNPKETVLMIVDVQEKLAVAMPSEAMERLVKNTELLLEAAKLLGVRVIASEQYPKGLGPTIAPLLGRLTAMSASPIEKLTFDACAEPRISKLLATSSPRAVVVVGMETHVCVFQTARELVRRGIATYVVSDAVASRREEHRHMGLALAERAGAIPTVAETVVFDWLEKAGNEPFKALSKLIR
jgi:nicotinamidase-related amidase